MLGFEGKVRSWLFASASVLVAAAMPAVALAAEPATAPAADTGTLGEVVVTAQRVQSTVQKAPLAVTAFDDRAMKAKQVVDVVTLIKNVPNFSGANNVTLPTAVSLFMRGIGSTDSGVTADPPVALYIDDVVVARQQLNNAGVFDLARIEVLRGPQGTLYGRNTAAGAIKFVTNPPTDEYEGWIEGAVGNYSSRVGRGVVNIPIVSGKLLARGNFVFTDRDGWTDNLTTGRKINDLNTWAFRGALRYIVSDTLELNLKADSSKVFSHGIVGTDTAGVYVPSTGDLFKVHSGDDPRNDGRTQGVNFYVDWTLSDSLVLKSIAGYRFTKQDYSFDFSDQPVPAYINASKTNSEQYSEELQLSGNFSERFQFVAGVFVMRELSQQFYGPQTFRNYSRVNGVFPAPGTQNVPRDPVLVYNEDYRVRTDTFAAYVQGSYNLTEKLKIELGGRYTRDDKQFTATAVQGPPGALTFLFNTADVIRATGSPNQKEFSQFTPHVGVSYEITPDILAYASYTKGFQAGGWFGRVRAPAALVLFNETTTTSYEGGVKSTFLDGKARLNVNFFHTEQKDLPTSYASLARPGTFAVASLNPTVYGAEFEGAIRATPELTFTGSLGLLESEYKNFGALPVEVRPSIGRELRFAPKTTAKIGFDYARNVSDWTVRLSNNYAYSSKQWLNTGNTPAGRAPARTLVDASISAESPDGRYILTVSCANCADKRYVANSLDFGGVRGGGLPVSLAFAGDPRTIQAALRLNF